MPKIEFTPELVKSQADLKELPENQLNAILTLGNNLLTTAIDEKTREHYDRYDQILGGTGIERKPNEKSLDYAERVRDSIKSAVGSVSSKDAEIEALKKSIKEGNTDPAIKKALDEAQEEAKNLKNAIKEWEKKNKSDVENASKEAVAQKAENRLIKEDIEFGKALSGVTFNDKYTKEDREILIDAKKALIRSKFTSEEITDSTTGVKSIVWKNNATGLVELNPEKGMTPITGADLLLKEIPSLIDSGVQRTGTGSTPPKGDKGIPFQLNGAKTQLEADDAIKRWQIAQGRDMIHPDTAEEALKMRIEAKVSALPVQ